MQIATIKPQRPRIDQLLERYRETIGADFAGYRNHVYRTVTYAMHFLGDDPQYEVLVETAFVYHDLGLWTAHELAYLEPSEKLALRDNEKFEWGLDPDALRAVIHWHHKLYRFRGPHERVIEACRKADWIDATQGWLRKGLNRSTIAAVESMFPNCGFHKSLVRLAKDYSGSTVLGLLRVTRGIIKW
jgi:hypothetical protein